MTFKTTRDALLIVILASGSAFGQGAKDTKGSSGEPGPTAGCASTEAKSGGKGTQERFFAAPVPKVAEALTEALAALEFDVTKNKDNMIEAHKRRHVGVLMSSGGEKVVLRLKEAESEGHKGTAVNGDTIKGLVGRMGQRTWTGAILDQTACSLEKSAL